MTRNHLHKVIGIDLGTTYSAVAAYNPQTLGPETLNNSAESDGATTASVISMDPFTHKAVVGAWAKRNRPADPENTIIEIKREMGEMFSETTLAKFQGERGGHVLGQPVRARFGEQWLLPQELSAFTLMRMKQVAEEEIGEEIRDAVVTVPAYFTERQRAATREAALLAGLYPRQILPEPTAAAIAYGLERGETDRRVYLVYDLGGGTFDVSIIDVEGAKIEVIATAGDPRLGGGDFDDAIAAWAIDQLARQHRLDLDKLQPERAARFRAELKLKAEQAKIILSSASDTSLIFPEIMVDLHLQTPPFLRLTREKFEELIGEYLRRSLSYVDEAIKWAAENRSVKREDVTAIILVGGSSKIPRVKALLLEYFQKGEEFVRADADPDQVVARGAAIEAYRYQPSPPPFDARRPVDNNALMNVDAGELFIVRHITEFSLGVGVLGGKVARIINQGTNIPTEFTDDRFTNAGPVTEIPVQVYQGESLYQAECTPIGIVPITGIEPLPAEKHRFAVTFKLDMNGLLTASILQSNTGKAWSATFQHRAGVGGIDAIAAMRKKLLGLFIGRPSAAAPAVDSAMAVPPPAIPPHYTIPPPPPVPVAVGAGSGAVGATAQLAVPAAQPSALVIPARELGQEEGQLVRRAQKLFLSFPDPKLLRAHNEFVTAWNDGVVGNDLGDLFAELRDTFADARRQAPPP